MDGIIVGDIMVAAVENLQLVQVDPGLKARSAFALNEIAGQLVVTGKVINFVAVFVLVIGGFQLRSCNFTAVGSQGTRYRGDRDAAGVDFQGCWVRSHLVFFLGDGLVVLSDDFNRLNIIGCCTDVGDDGGWFEVDFGDLITVHEAADFIIGLVVRLPVVSPGPRLQCDDDVVHSGFCNGYAAGFRGDAVVGCDFCRRILDPDADLVRVNPGVKTGSAVSGHKVADQFVAFQQAFHTITVPVNTVCCTELGSGFFFSVGTDCGCDGGDRQVALIHGQSTRSGGHSVFPFRNRSAVFGDKLYSIDIV